LDRVRADSVHGGQLATHLQWLSQDEQCQIVFDLARLELRMYLHGLRQTAPRAPLGIRSEDLEVVESLDAMGRGENHRRGDENPRVRACPTILRAGPVD